MDPLHNSWFEPAARMEPGGGDSTRESFSWRPQVVLALICLGLTALQGVPTFPGLESSNAELILQVSVEATGVRMQLTEASRDRWPGAEGFSEGLLIGDGLQMWTPEIPGTSVERPLGRSARALVGVAANRLDAPRVHVRVWIRGGEGVSWQRVLDLGRSVEAALGEDLEESHAASVRLAVDTRTFQ